MTAMSRKWKGISEGDPWRPQASPDPCPVNHTEPAPWGRAESTCSHCGRTHWIRVERVGPALVVALSPARSLELQELGELIQQLHGVLEVALESPEHWIVLDFEDTRLWTLLERTLETFFLMRDRLNAIGGRLVLCRLRPDVLESLRSLGHHDAFEIETDIQAALDRL